MEQDIQRQEKIKVLYWSHIHSVQRNLSSAFNPSPRSSGQPQHGAQGPTPDSKLVPQSRVLTGDRPNVHVLMVGETGAPGENPRRYGGGHANST